MSIQNLCQQKLFQPPSSLGLALPRGQGFLLGLLTAFHPTNESSEESGSITWARGLAASSLFLPMAWWVTQTCHPTPLRDCHSFHTPTATPTCLNSFRGVSVPVLQVTLAAYLMACLYRCSDIPLVFRLPHSSLEVGGWGADSQRNGLRLGPPPPFPLLHMPLCTQGAFWVYLVPFEYPLWFVVFHFP